MATKDVKRGEEILLDYGGNRNFLEILFDYGFVPQGPCPKHNRHGSHEAMIAYYDCHRKLYEEATNAANDEL